MRCSVKRTGVAGVTVLVVASLAAGGCGNSGSPGAASCLTQHAAAGRAGTAPGGSPDPAAWTLPGGNLANTRDVASSISSSDVSTLGVAWCVPVESTGQARAAGLTDGYSTTPVVVHGVVYTQDMESNVMAIELATGKVLWTHDYSSPNGGPDGVNVAGGVVYAATNHAAVALSAATGRQLWSRTLTGNDREGIDMAPGYDDGTVYISTVPVNPAVGAYLGGGKGILWALNAATGAILLKTPLSSGANAPVTIDGDYVIAGAGVQGTPGQQQLITALQPRRPRRCDNHAHRTAWLSQSRGPAAGRASGGTTTTSTELVVAGSARLRCFVLACQCDGPGPRQ